MDWQHLPTFLSVARQGSLAGAARDLGVNHSTVFRRLKVLEQAVGARLFEPHQNGYNLTALGEDMLKQARDIEQSMADLERLVVGQDRKPSGTIRLTAPANIAEKFLPRYLVSFRALYPDITVELLVGNQYFDLARGEADIAIRATKTPPDYLIATQLCQIPWRFFAAEEFIAEHGKPTTHEALQLFPLIGAKDDLALLPGFRWLKKEYGEKIVVRANSLNVMSYLAEAGMGIALLPHDQIRTHLVPLELRPTAEASCWWLLTHPDLRNSERIRLFKSHITKAIKQDQKLQFNNTKNKER